MASKVQTKKRKAQPVDEHEERNEFHEQDLDLDAQSGIVASNNKRRRVEETVLAGSDDDAESFDESLSLDEPEDEQGLALFTLLS